jgi:hypothetical protein
MSVYGRRALGSVCYMGGVPAVLEEFCWSWSQMIQFNQEFICDDKHFIHYDRVKFSDHAPARNALAGRFLGEWLVMLDTDHQFEPDIVRRLLHRADTYDLDVVTGLYQFKTPPYSPVAFEWDEDLIRPICSWPESLELFQIGSSGAGCLFVRKRVFDAIHTTGEQPFDRIHPLSEDHSFFRRLRNLEIKAYIDPRIHCNHLVVRPVELTDYEGNLGESKQVAVEGYKNG